MVTHIEPTDGVPLDEPPTPITLTKLEVQQNFINNTYNGLFDKAKSQISTVIIIISGVVQELELKMKVTKHQRSHKILQSSRRPLPGPSPS